MDGLQMAESVPTLPDRVAPTEGTIREPIFTAEIPNERAHLPIEDVADIGEEVMLDLIVHARTYQSAEESGLEIDGAGGLHQQIVRIALVFAQARCVGWKVSRGESREHRIAHGRDAHQIEPNDVERG